MTNIICSRCGKEFRVPPSRGGQKYCSRSCGYIDKRQSPLDTFNRFVSKSSDPDGCWDWTAAKTQRGYGLMTIWDGVRRHRRDMAHRFSYKLHTGPIPPGMFVCHTCDNPPCSNPSHLFLGTSSDNLIDARGKGRLRSHNALKTHCPRGHPLAERGRDGKRRCKICQREHTERYLNKGRTGLVSIATNRAAYND